MGLAKTERELAAKGEGCLGKAADDELCLSCGRKIFLHQI
jgi:hypothetical protein